MEGFVYFALGHGTAEGAPKRGLVKIGYSTDPIGRAAQLRGVLLAARRGTRQDEADLHALFAADRVWPHAEWFEPSRGLLGHILDVVRSEPHSAAALVRMQSEAT